jgi:hypothetical protein
MGFTIDERAAVVGGLIDEFAGGSIETITSGK